jgi:selenocysteine-specific elongation factor
VRALTGVDTDRLKEEKARGISIELGYAYAPLPDGGVLGFVDVPGHERFVDHMVAGVTGIDFVLLVVAADDGPMPQTLEHLDIVQRLGVREGAVALTKIDRCEPARIAECEREIRTLLAATALAAAPIFPVSSVTRTGIDALMAQLVREAAAPRHGRSGAGFRLAVDRGFTLDGVGTVVTGTVFSGEVRVGDELRITPSGAAARVRSIHAQNRPAQTGRAGERCALALAGVAKDAVARGDWAVAPPLHAPTARFDARLAISARETKPLRHWSAVHLHLGAAHLLARVVLLDGEQLAPGEEGLVQLVLERPIGALAGDAFILRDASAARTLGGGRVVDPFGAVRKRRTPARLQTLRRMAEPDPRSRLAALLEDAAQGLDLKAYRLAFNLAPGDSAVDASTRRVREGEIDVAFGAENWAALRERLLGRVAQFHVERPDELGLDLGRLRRMVFQQLDAAVVYALAASLVEERRLARTGPWWHLPGHGATLSAREQRLAEGALPLIEAGGFDPPWVRDLAKRLRADEAEMRSLLIRLARRGEVYRVVKDLFYARSAVGRLACIAREVEDRSGAVRAAEFRDRLSLGRKRAIQILEFFDRIGYTRRAGDDHRLRSDSLIAFDAHASRESPHAEARP